mgnify:CR=1 FL=1
MEKRSLIHKIDFLWRGLDRTLGLIVLALVAISIVTFISATSGTHVQFIDQARNLIVSIGLMLIVSRIPPKWLEKSAIWIYTIGIALLLAVAAFGLIKKGARRWLNIGVVIQPSEIMKIAMPLMLAWAVTIHKSQGKTLDKVKVDLSSGAFASGQVYVALSRCRSIEGISLERPIVLKDVRCDPEIKRFYMACLP